MGEKNNALDRAYKRHSVLVAIFAVYILIVAISTVYAANLINYTYDSTEVIEEAFVPVELSCSVKDNGNGTYTITNNSTTSVYMRCSPVPNWVSLADGKAHWDMPSYTVTVSDNTKWMSRASTDGYYYYVSPLAPNESVTITVTNNDAKMPPVNHEFKVNLVTEIIQSEPITAMQEAWGVNMVPNSQNGNGLVADPSGDDPQQGMGGTK